MNSDSESIGRVIKAANSARKNAYAPYSNFTVGAGLLTREGNIYQGSNIENASYGLTVCAERVAVFKAVSRGDDELLSLAVITGEDYYVTPCGACLQVLKEFSDDMEIILVKNMEEYKLKTLKELLPEAFDGKTIYRSQEEREGDV